MKEILRCWFECYHIATYCCFMIRSTGKVTARRNCFENISCSRIERTFFIVQVVYICHFYTAGDSSQRVSLFHLQLISVSSTENSWPYCFRVVHNTMTDGLVRCRQGLFRASPFGTGYFSKHIIPWLYSWTDILWVRFEIKHVIKCGTQYSRIFGWFWFLGDSPQYQP